MKLFIATMIALFGLVGIAQAQASSAGKFFTVECPKDARLQTKKTGAPNTIRVRCVQKVATKVKYPKCPVGAKLTKKEDAKGRDLCQYRAGKKKKAGAICAQPNKYRLAVKKKAPDRCESKAKPKTLKPKIR